LKKAMLYGFYVLLGLFLAFVAIGYALPDKAHVERQAVINAPAEKIYAIISDLQRNQEWSPWLAVDPAIKVTFEGAGPGVGQKLIWESTNPQVGSGSQTTAELIANEKVVSALDFEGSKAVATLQLAPEGTATKVTWAFDAALGGLLERWFGLLFDGWIGPDYEKGLAALKALAEKA